MPKSIEEPLQTITFNCTIEELKFGSVELSAGLDTLLIVP